MLLLLITAASAQSLLQTGQAEMEIVISGQANSPQTIFVPQNTERQNVVYPEGMELEEDQYGNKILNVSGEYEYIFHVSVDASKPRLNDEDYPLEQKENKYLENAYLVNASNKEIQERLDSIIGRTDSTLEAIARITSWVNENLEYKETSKMKNTEQILENLTGVCSEYTTLYTAIARAAGIPTRITTGMANTGTKWERHAWAESLVNGTWVPVEPTYKEAGTKNALAIKLYSAPTYQSYLMPNNTEEIEVNTKKTDDYDLELESKASVSEKTLAPRDVFYVQTTITNNEKGHIMPSYMIQKHVGITMADQAKKILIVPPGETKTLEWKLIAPYGDREEYVIFIKGPLTEEKMDITIDPEQTKEEDNKIELETAYVRKKENKILVDVKIKNIGNTYTEPTIRTMMPLGTKQKKISMTPGEEQTVSFEYISEPGIHEYEITVSTTNQTKTITGSITIPPDPTPMQNLLKEWNQNLYSSYFIIVAVVVLVVIISIAHPKIKKPKQLFQEKDTWHKLMNIKRP